MIGIVAAMADRSAGTLARADFFAGKRCLLTGAASGIGRATALKLARHGAQLYLTDRDAAGLAVTVADARALGADVAEYRALDISDYDAVAAFAADIHTRHPAMDIVMNIAGVSAWGTVDQLTHRHWRSMIDINLMGPIHIIETFVPPMVAAGRGGQLVNVSSAAGLVALPWHAAYSASKYGLRGLSEVLRFDLARHGIGVSVVVPGAVKTPLVKSVEIAGVDRDDPRVVRWVDRFSGHAVSPERVATAILTGVVRNRFLVYTSPDIQALYAFKRFAWWPYSVAMRRVNVFFTRALRPSLRHHLEPPAQDASAPHSLGGPTGD
jgi:NAD(P)-dependent dehydrogenase (short-subunit alcohol dehydrogenase family)